MWKPSTSRQVIPKNRLSKSYINEQQTIILDREGKLTSTDYIAAKIAEGKATKSEYADKIAERQQWRDDINAANAEIERLKTMEPEPEYEQ